MYMYTKVYEMESTNIIAHIQHNGHMGNILKI